jgi:cytoskeletal protein RodZ
MEEIQANQTNQPETIGQKLKAAREAKNIDISSVATDTRIKISFLEALEHSDFKALPNLVTARGFMKVYADYLGLPIKEFVDQFNAIFPDQVVGANSPRNPNEIRVGLEVDQRELFPASMKTMNSSSATYAKGGYHGALKPKQIALGVIGVIILLALMNLYFKNSMESITTVPRQATDMVTLDAKTTPETQTAQTTTDSKKAFITMEALNKTYLQIIIDGRMFFRGNVNKGDVKTWQGDQYIRIKAAVPRNVHLFVNGRDEGIMADQMTMLEKTYFPGSMPATTNTPITPEVKKQSNTAAAPAPVTVKTEPAPTTPAAETQTTSANPQDQGVYGF